LARPLRTDEMMAVGESPSNRAEMDRARSARPLQVGPIRCGISMHLELGTSPKRFEATLARSETWQPADSVICPERE